MRYKIRKDDSRAKCNLSLGGEGYEFSLGFVLVTEVPSIFALEAAVLRIHNCFLHLWLW